VGLDMVESGLLSSQYGSSKRLWERHGSAFAAGFSIFRERDGDIQEARTPAPEISRDVLGLATSSACRESVAARPGV